MNGNRRLLPVSAVSLALCTLGFTAEARAADPPLPAGTTTDAKASTGETNITTEKAATIIAKDAKERKDATELSVSAGTMGAAGNAKLFAATAGMKYRYRRDDDQLTAAASGNYGRTAPPGGADSETVVQNFQGLARYDRFLDDFSVFLQGQGRNDRFQGLNARLNVDPGAGYYFINEPTTLLWIEVGYDLLFDARRDDARILLDSNKKPIVAANGQAELIAKTQTVHSARLFAGHELAIEPNFKLSLGLEYLQGLAASEVRPGTKASDLYRINGIASATAKAFGNYSLGIAYTGRYDHGALPGKERLDTIVSANFVYTIFLTYSVATHSEDALRRIARTNSARR